MSEQFSVVLLDRAMFTDLSERQWSMLCDEIAGRVENYIEEIIDEVLTDVQEETDGNN
jgi:hypothetical protein